MLRDWTMKLNLGELSNSRLTLCKVTNDKLWHRENIFKVYKMISTTVPKLLKYFMLFRTCSFFITNSKIYSFNCLTHSRLNSSFFFRRECFVERACDGVGDGRQRQRADLRAKGLRVHSHRGCKGWRTYGWVAGSLTIYWYSLRINWLILKMTEHSIWTQKVSIQSYAKKIIGTKLVIVWE